jgi:pimeloyl-ACP methyl ester carboxylesterase
LVVKIFVHGVPDTPALWKPLLDELALKDGEYACLALPGFASPFPAGFEPHREAYAAWLVGEIEELAGEHGPIDLVGHDWGAILSLRAASLRPDLIASWAVSGALIDENYPGHKVARIWNTPLAGELFMALSPPAIMERTSRLFGMPSAVAKAERPYWDAPMKRAILGLYRSADGLRIRGPWAEKLKGLPKKGALIWGRHDPYIPVRYAERLAEKQDVPLTVLDAGHWVVAEKPRACAEVLKQLWSAGA